MRSTFSTQGVFLVLGQRKGRAIIDRRLAHVQLLFTLKVEFDRCLEAFVKTAHVDQFLLCIQILIHTL